MGAQQFPALPRDRHGLGYRLLGVNSLRGSSDRIREDCFIMVAKDPVKDELSFNFSEANNRLFAKDPQQRKASAQVR